MQEKYSLQIDQPNFTPNERLQAVMEYFTEEGYEIIPVDLHTVIINEETYRILSRSENSSTLKTILTPNLAFSYMIRLEKIK